MSGNHFGQFKAYSQKPLAGVLTSPGLKVSCDMLAEAAWQGNHSVTMMVNASSSHVYVSHVPQALKAKMADEVAA